MRANIVTRGNLRRFKLAQNVPKLTRVTKEIFGIINESKRQNSRHLSSMSLNCDWRRFFLGAFLKFFWFASFFKPSYLFWIPHFNFYGSALLSCKRQFTIVVVWYLLKYNMVHKVFFAILFQRRTIFNTDYPWGVKYRERRLEMRTYLLWNTYDRRNKCMCMTAFC